MSRVAHGQAHDTQDALRRFRIIENGLTADIDFGCHPRIKRSVPLHDVLDVAKGGILDGLRVGTIALDDNTQARLLREDLAPLLPVFGVVAGAGHEVQA